MAWSRVELFEQIRRDRRIEGLSIRELADKHGVHRRTVRQALASAIPPPRKAYPRRSRPAIDPYVEVIDGWLRGDRDAPRKQRHTARRVWQRLVAEHGAMLAEVTVSRYVARRRVELGLDRVEVAVPQTHPPGAEAEVDFGEFSALIGGTWIKLWMFVMRLSHSGRAFHLAFATQAQEAFLQGHVAGFAHFGAVPSRIRYDNLKPAVVRVLRGRDRAESERFIALRSHYGYESFFCIPGKEGAHEKGGVEGEIGRFRRRHLVPVPHVGSLAELRVWPATTTCSPGRHMSTRSDTAAQAAIGAAARELHLPTVRDEAHGWPRSRCGNGTPTSASSPRSSPPRSTTAANGAAPAGSPKPTSPGSNGWPSSTSTPCPASRPPPGHARHRRLHRRRRAGRAAR